jgi:predicted nucleic acid-binding protein
MIYLADSDLVADYLNGQQAAVALLNGLLPAGLAISLVTYGEIYDGVYGGRNPGAAERAFRQFLRSVSVLPLNRAIMREFARIRETLRRQGMRIGDNDVMIAATAIYHNRELATRNVRHFGRIPGLKLHQHP